MARGELFDLRELRAPLSPQERDTLARQIIRSARLGAKFFYAPDECAGILRLSYDEILAKLKLLKIDCILILSIMRVPWWSLAGYLIDPGDDIDAAVYEYLDSLPRPPKLKQ
ncbi:hypothetical protein [Treponema endosymbiont of Eucomonympha sp.]|uniref:hypothetical protein n=1 Tax=Treponema endosymbiont of Eucomonympha sp. TaxID=1580831 RepID=UPI00075170B7|nr:hypothetical protein [Treponema endosymbiont of Eucomonympha sp.]